MTAALIERLVATGPSNGVPWLLNSLKWRRLELLERIRKSKKAYTKDPMLAACQLLIFADEDALRTIDRMILEVSSELERSAPRVF